MNKNEIIEIITMIAVEYPKDIDLNDKKIMFAKVNLWHESLKNCDKELVAFATRKTLEQNHFCPKLADIISQIRQIEKVNEKSPEELWAEFEVALCKASNYISCFKYAFRDESGLTQGEIARNNLTKLYKSLNSILQEYCGNENGFKSIAMQDGDLSFEKGRFIKAYDRLHERINIKKEISGINILQLTGNCLIKDNE